MWLLVGGDSEIGAATHQFLKARGHAVSATTRRKQNVAIDRPFLDLSAPLDTWEPPAGTTAACIFAAIARIAACDADPQGSGYVNVTQTLALADQLLARGIPVLFLSTNHVFDGKAPNVAANAAYSPTTEYGRQKVAAETALRARSSGAFQPRSCGLPRLFPRTCLWCTTGSMRSPKANHPRIRRYDDGPHGNRTCSSSGRCTDERCRARHFPAYRLARPVLLQYRLLSRGQARCQSGFGQGKQHH